MAIGDIFQIVASGTYLSVNCNNVFWYVQDGSDTPTGILQIAQAFDQQVLANLVDIQHEAFTWTNVLVTNWTTGLAQVVYPVSREGSVLAATTEPAPSFVQYSFTYPRTQPLYSSGGKRLAGVPELYMVGNAEAIPGADLTAVENALTAVLTGSGGLNLAPIVLVTQLNKVALPSKMAEPPYTYWRIQDIIFRGLSTQRTRLQMGYNTP